MIQATTIKELGAILQPYHQTGKKVGLVPTMGALHQGHISIILTAKKENQLVVCSIFVNPTQFNEKKDLDNYPRTPESDLQQLEKAGCDVVFMPSVEEMYPDDRLLDIDFGNLERVMEGAFRPGHFKGMATIVHRFFTIVKPDNAYFGEKDFQQLAIIRAMNTILKLGIRIVGCPTYREPDGLAMSSRNIHLTHEERLAAPMIYVGLQLITKMIKIQPIEQIKSVVIQKIEEGGLLKVQYLELVDSVTLQPIEGYDESREQRACIAVLTSKTRLIDNIGL